MIGERGFHKSDEGVHRERPSSRVSLYDLHPNTRFIFLLLLWAMTGCAQVTVTDVHPSDSEDMIQPRSSFPLLDLGAHGLKISFPQEPLGNGIRPPDFASAYKTPRDERQFEPRWLPSITRTSMVSSDVPVVSEDDSSWDLASGMPEIQEPLMTLLGDDFAPPRLPLRQLMSHHPAMTLLGNDLELRLPHSYFLAHRDQVSSRPFRNYRAGLRDQPLLHPETFGDPSEESKLPEIGPPPPHHSAKTFAILTVLSIAGIGFYAVAPSSFLGTTELGGTKDPFAPMRDAWTKPPVIDKDPAIVNYLGHPYIGASFYLTQRNYGESPLYSFLFSTLSSTCFEYLVESWSERPSIQDLIVTPIVGSLMGELLFLATQEMRKDGFTTFEKILVTIVNPLYVMQNGYR